MSRELTIGARMRRSALGSEAIYEIIEAGGDIVTAAVVSAPGLPAGMEVRLSARDARAMEPLAARPSPQRAPSARTRRAALARRRRFSAP
ncbi:MAG TPA: hypothetical protein VHX66_09150 [Solirubrobacteraceae bacterium]|jgi:hypothetical protein|nr:hypothetical protein [Solirubrobacteraceae bacterium]